MATYQILWKETQWHRVEVTAERLAELLETTPEALATEWPGIDKSALADTLSEVEVTQSYGVTREGIDVERIG